jgi:hypothetical protein
MSRHQPPHNLDAEKALIGCALINLTAAQATNLPPEHFYNPHHQIIWHHILKATGKLDHILLAATLANNGHTSSEYTATTLTQYALDTPTTSNTDRYAQQITDTWHRRNIIHQAAQITEAAYTLPTDHLTTLLTNLQTDHTRTLTNPLQTVNWDEFWADDTDPEDWLIHPIIPRGRAVALYAPAKAGKSTILLAAIAAACTGKPVLGHHTQPPCTVLYLDYEMTRHDLAERLTLLGYGPTDNLTKLHYALLPTLPPLDTAAGAHALLTHATTIGADLVAVDTFGRAVQGEENESDTVRNFYRHTGQALKAAGIAVVRTDHAGKDKTKGQRGSSAKNDDVDLIWSLERTDTGVILRRTHSRITWAKEAITIDQTHTGDDTIDYRDRHSMDTYPEGTKELIHTLNQLGIPPNASMRTVQTALRTAGHKHRNTLIRAAQRARRNDLKLPGNPEITNAQACPDPAKSVPHDPSSGAHPDSGHTAGHTGAHPTKPLHSNGAHHGAHRGTPEPNSPRVPPLYKERHTGHACPDDLEEQLNFNPDGDDQGDWPF